jgi:hypothetical protein
MKAESTSTFDSTPDFQEWLESVNSILNPRINSRLNGNILNEGAMPPQLKKALASKNKKRKKKSKSGCGCCAKCKCSSMKMKVMGKKSPKKSLKMSPKKSCKNSPKKSYKNSPKR